MGKHGESSSSKGKHNESSSRKSKHQKEETDSDSSSGSDVDSTDNLIELVERLIPLKVQEYLNAHGYGDSDDDSDEDSSDDDSDEEVEFKVKSSRAQPPKYGSESAAGADLCIMGVALGKDGKPDAVKDAEGTVLGYRYRTGICVALPEGNVGLLVPRSSFIKYGADLMNEIGIIDSDYRGEILIALRYNKDPSRVMEFEETKPVFQLVIVPYTTAKFTQVTEFSEQTERGEGGFGSTDAKR